MFIAIQQKILAVASAASARRNRGAQQAKKKTGEDFNPHRFSRFDSLAYWIALGLVD